MWTRHTLMTWLTSVVVATSITLSGAASTVEATSLRPSRVTLNQSSKYFLKNANWLASRYKLDYGSQTALPHQGATKIYVASHDQALNRSVNLAIRYWNQKMGRTIFSKGTASRHNLAVTVTRRNTSADAWWRPAQRQIQLEAADYTQKAGQIKTKMMKQSTTTAINKANKKIRAYGKAIAGQSNYVARYNRYRSQQIKAVNSQLTKQRRHITTQHLDIKARTFDYANIIAHELGHSLGLLHSPNKQDAMYAGSTTPAVYRYSKVKSSQNGFNQLDSTDVNRAKLALKVHNSR